MIKIKTITLYLLLLISSNSYAELIGITECGSECEENLPNIGSYLEGKVPDKGAVISIWSFNSKPVHECLMKNILNSGEWYQFGNNSRQFRAFIEAAVNEKCVRPMLSHTDLVIEETFLEKERFFDPESNQEYGLEPNLIPIGSYLNQAWVRVRVNRRNKSTQQGPSAETR